MAYETILHRWFEEVWNHGNESTIDELWAEDAIAHGLTDAAGNEIRGPEAFKPYFLQLRTAFPDIHISIEDWLTDGDKIMVRCEVTGTHAGPGFTPAPTHRSVKFSGMSLVRTRHGQIAEGWNNFDFLSLYLQIGLQLG